MRQARQRGFVLVTALLVITGLATLASVTLTRSMTELAASQRFVAAQQSFALSEGGLDQGIAWMRSQPAPPTCLLGAVCVVYNTVQTLATGTQTITITPASNNGASYQDAYTITTTSTSSGIAVNKTLNLTMQIESFARYAYFSDQEMLPGGTKIWFTDQSHIRGPTHSNDQFHIRGNPVFDGAVSTASPTIDYGGCGPPNDNPQFNGGLTLGADKIDMPQPSLNDLQSEASLVVQGNTTAKLEGKYLRLTTNGITQVVPISTNPVVFVNGGDLTIDGGTLDGQLTLISNKSVKLNGSVTYACNPENPTGDADCLDGQSGNVAYNDDILGIVASNNVTVSRDAPNDMTIQGTIMAVQGSFGVENYQNGLKGTLHIYGGLIQKVRGAVGTFSSSTLAKVSGYSKDYWYDERLLSLSPPRYPTTGTYQILFWQDQSVAGQAPSGQ